MDSVLGLRSVAAKRSFIHINIYFLTVVIAFHNYKYNSLVFSVVHQFDCVCVEVVILERTQMISESIIRYQYL